jgi:hypothetical protein
MAERPPIQDAFERQLRELAESRSAQHMLALQAMGMNADLRRLIMEGDGDIPADEAEHHAPRVRNPQGGGIRRATEERTRREMAAEDRIRMFEPNMPGEEMDRQVAAIVNTQERAIAAKAKAKAKAKAAAVVEEVRARRGGAREVRI